MEKKYITGGGIVFGIFAVLLALLLPFHFSYLDYFEYGFAQRKSTGVVDTSKVYEHGRHPLGIDFQFKTFSSTVHNVVLKNIFVFTKDKIQIEISVAFQYFLRKEDLKFLHDSYDIGYESVMESSATDALKGITAQYSLHQFFKDRPALERGMFIAIRERLSGICCEPSCQPGNKKCLGCQKQAGQCSEEEKGLFVDVRYLQLRDVQIDDDVQYKYIKKLIQNAKAERESYVQEATLVTKDIEELVKSIENEADVVYQNGTAQAALIRAKANADARALKENAISDGLKYLYNRLGIRSDKHKASFTYLRALRDHPSLHLSLGYDSTILQQPAG